MSNNVMTPNHEAWEEFMEHLTGPEGIDVKDNSPDELSWRCKGGYDKTYSTAILEKYYPDIDVEATMEYFNSHGGHCDCEIFWNVDSY